MFVSVDEEASAGTAGSLNSDRDLPRIVGIQEGLHQYYEIEQTTDLWPSNSGGVREKPSVDSKETSNKLPVSFVMIDNRHLTKQGIRYFCTRSKEFMLATSNAGHPTSQINEDNLHIICQSKLSLTDALVQLRLEYGCQRITVQSGDTLNGLFFRKKLLNYINIVIAPIPVGGKDTFTLIDGRSLLSESELS